MPLGELLPQAGKFECILRAKTRIAAHPIAAVDTQALKVSRAVHAIISNDTMMMMMMRRRRR
jgi:hypothetical protein